MEQPEATGSGAQPPASEPLAPEEALRRRAADAESIVEFIDHSTLGSDEEGATGEITNLDQHPADTSDITFQRELDLTVRQMAETRVAQVEEALERQREGLYGICANCGKPIDPERLQARPEATLCIDCQRQHDAANTR